MALTNLFFNVESKVFQPQLKEPEFGKVEFSDLEIFYYIKKNIDKSDKNEDCLFIHQTTKEILFGVCDGAGGYPNGAEVSHYISSKISDVLKAGVDEREFLSDLNVKLKNEYSEGKSTLASCHYKDSSFKFSSVGDSEIIIIKDEDIIYQNVSHSPVGFQMQAGALDQEEALTTPGRNIVLYLMGDKNFHIDCSSKVEFDDSMLLVCASDGLFDNFTQNDLISILSNDLNDGVEELKNYCNEQFYQDNWHKDDDICFFVVRKK